MSNNSLNDNRARSLFMHMEYALYATRDHVMHDYFSNMHNFFRSVPAVDRLTFIVIDLDRWHHERET